MKVTISSPPSPLPSYLLLLLPPSPFSSPANLFFETLTTLLCILYGYFQSTLAEFNSCDSDCLIHETYFLSQEESFVIPILLLLLLLQSCPTLCDPIDGSPPGSSVPGILQARILEWVAISFSNSCMHVKSLQSCLTLCDPMDSSPPGSSVHGILQARILAWVAISLSRFLFQSPIKEILPFLISNLKKNQDSGRLFTFLRS